MQQRDGGRREAVPIKEPDRLTDAQRAIFDAIDRRITEMAEAGSTGNASGPSSDDGEPRGSRFLFLPTIDYERRSRVMLIDGGRGSGKTSLLLTLLDHWSTQLLESPPRRILPVRIVELSPLPQSTSLLFLLVSSLRPIIAELERERFGREPPKDDAAFGHDTAPWQGGRDRDLRSLGAWRKFVRTAATGWSRDMEQRQSQLDPEAFALELEQAEDHRLNVVADFRRLIDALVDDIRDSRNLGHVVPLIVVPIDDADMNTDMLVGLLELVRTLHHPRLVFLMTGWTQLFLDTLTPNLLARLVMPLRKAGAPPSMIEEAVTRAKQLAHRIYDKSIALDHRFVLTPLHPTERWERLKPSLKRLEVKTNASPPTTDLDAYMALAPILREALPSRMRDLVDFEARVARITVQKAMPQGEAPTRVHDDAPPGYAETIRTLWTAAIDDAQLSTEPKHVAEDAVRIAQPSGGLLVVEASVTVEPPLVDFSSRRANSWRGIVSNAASSSIGTRPSRRSASRLKQRRRSSWRASLPWKGATTSSSAPRKAGEAEAATSQGSRSLHRQLVES